MALCISFICSCGRKGTFEDFLEQLFIDEVSANTINLHFTLENPKEYGIKSYAISYGDISKKSRDKQLESIQETKLKLLSYPYLTLNKDEQLT